MKFTKNLIYEEIGKQVYMPKNKDYAIIKYADDFVLNGKKLIKKRNISNVFCLINSFFFDYLRKYNIPTGFIERIDQKSLKLIKHERFPFYIRVVNYIDKRTSKIFNIKEGKIISLPIFEYRLGVGVDNLVTESHLLSLGICSYKDFKVIKRICSKTNAVLRSFCERRNHILMDFNLYFGKDGDKIFLIDDFSPLSLRINSLNYDSHFKNEEDFNNYLNSLIKLIS